MGRRGQPPPRSYEVIEYAGGAFDPRQSLPLAPVLADPKLRLVTREAQRALRGASTIGDHCSVSRGEELGKSSLDRFAPGTAVPAGCIPVVSGAGIARFRPPRLTHLAEAADVRKPARNYRSPKVLVVKTGREFVATVDYDHAVTLQSVYNLQSVSEVPCEVICAVLNSRVVNDELRRLVTDQKKLFPQITQSNILEVPMPSLSRQEVAALVSLVREAIVAASDRLGSVQSQIDRLIEAAYERAESTAGA